MVTSGFSIMSRECVSAGAAGARTRRSLGYHLLHPLILRLLVLCAPADLRLRALQGAPALRVTKVVADHGFEFSG